MHKFGVSKLTFKVDPVSPLIRPHFSRLDGYATVAAVVGIRLDDFAAATAFHVLVEGGRLGSGRGLS
jgi:hypothetical protein